MLTRRCFPMVLVWPFLASACRSAHRLHLPRIGNLFHADFRFAPSRLEQHSIASRATLETPIHEGMGAHGLRGRVPYCACCYQSLDCLCLNGRHFRSITSERPHAPRRSALCATCHPAVLTARGYPSLFGSQCRLVANCHQRADATSGIFYIEAGALVAADKAISASAVRGYHHSPEAFVPIIGHG